MRINLREESELWYDASVVSIGVSPSINVNRTQWNITQYWGDGDDQGSKRTPVCVAEELTVSAESRRRLLYGEPAGFVAVRAW